MTTEIIVADSQEVKPTVSISGDLPPDVDLNHPLLRKLAHAHPVWEAGQFKTILKQASEDATNSVKRAQTSYDQTTRLYPASIEPAEITNVGWPGNLAGTIVYFLSTYIAFQVGWWPGFGFLFIFGPICALVANMIVHKIYHDGLKQDQQRKISLKLDENSKRRAQDKAILKDTEKEEKATQHVVRALTLYQERKVDEHLPGISKSIQAVIKSLRFEVKVSTDPGDEKTRGKPVITWSAKGQKAKARDLLDDVEALTENIETKLYSAEGSLIKSDFGSVGTLIHMGDGIVESGEIIDAAPKAGDTRNYYLVIEATAINAMTVGDSFDTYTAVIEEAVHSERVTVPEFVSAEAALEKEMKDHATTVNRAKFEEQYQSTLAKMSGEAGDPESALKSVLEDSKSRRERERKKQDYVAQIEEELTAAGHSEEEIEEAIEAFLTKVDE